MTDRELLEKAAKAAGIENWEWWDEQTITYFAHDGYAWWSPLTDDGDALRLAVELRIEISPCDGIVIVNYPCGPDRELFEIHEEIHSDRYAATRRAIVRAAASIGEML